jgi:hypothetical protein
MWAMWPTVENPEGMSSKPGGRVALRISSNSQCGLVDGEYTYCPEIVI